MENLTQKFIDDYYYEAGHLHRRSDGKRVGCLDKRLGYYRMKAYGKSWLVHRVIFAIHEGWWPDMVDHIDRDKTNNQRSNLRAAKRNQNAVNSRSRSDNTTGWRGVIYHRAAKGYVAQSSDKEGNRVHLGVFSCDKEAALVYNYHAEKTWGKFATFNQVFEGQV